MDLIDHRPCKSTRCLPGEGKMEKERFLLEETTLPKANVD